MKKVDRCETKFHNTSFSGWPEKRYRSLDQRTTIDDQGDYDKMGRTTGVFDAYGTSQIQVKNSTQVSFAKVHKLFKKPIIRNESSMQHPSEKYDDQQPRILGGPFHKPKSLSIKYKKIEYPRILK
jgi:hypothetical protein